MDYSVLTLIVLFQRAAVGVYGDRVHNILESDMTLSDYGHAIAESVSYLQMFLRPVGDILTNETVREVKYHEAGFADNFSDVRDHLEAVAKGVYNLVSIVKLIRACMYRLSEVFLLVSGERISRHP